MNNVSLIGRLTKDPELRHTQSGSPTTNFTLAVDRNFKNAEGEREADFINCVAWRKLAETIAHNLSKGRRIGVTGRIQTRNYEDKDGVRRYVTEVVVEQMDFLDYKGNESEPDDGLQEVPF